MRALLLAGVSVLALSLSFETNAAMIVDSPVADIAAALGLENQAQSLAQGAKEIASWGQQLQLMQSQLQQMMTIYSVVSRVTDIGSAVGALGMVGIQNPLPVNPWAVQSLLSGHNTGFAGISATLGGLVNQNFSTNHVYTPTTGYPNDQILIDKGNGLAGLQGLSQRLYESISDRLPLLAELHTRITASPDIKETADLQARFAVEQSYVQAQLAQFQTVQQMAAAQQQVWQQAREEQRAKDLSDEIAQAAARGY